MPPLVPRKRLRQTPPPADVKTKSTPNGSASYERRKPTLYDDLDAKGADHSNSLLSALEGDEDDEGSSLSSHSDEEFEDVPIAKRQKKKSDETGDDDDDDDDDIEFEDVKAPEAERAVGHIPTGDLELTLTTDTRVSLANPYGEKKGPTKRERRVRYATHCVHVQTLLWHNAVRNAWCCDQEVQATLISHMTPKLWEQVDRWRRSSGLEKAPPKPVKKPVPKTKGKRSKVNVKKEEIDDHRDWGEGAEKLEEGQVDMSHGDPLFRLMQYLAPWWRKRFCVDVPGLRKWGYMPLERLDRLTKAHQTEEHDAARFGERLSTLHDFRLAARECRGSRDVGAQLFTALLRGLGLDCRMVANLQVLGFGWGKYEEAEPEPEKTGEADDGENKSGIENGNASIRSKLEGSTTSYDKKRKAEPPKRTRKKPRPEPEPEVLKADISDSDDDSVIEVSHTTKKPSTAKKYDADLEFPHYWTEVLSPVTKKYLPVEPFTKLTIATNRDLVESFEPRGAKADRARQTMAYVVGHNQDGTAKDVTVRYLRKQMMPGRTKGVRMPPEKVPIRGNNGKVKRYEMFDWFKTAMSPYNRGTRKCPFTEVDEAENATDLRPAQPEKKPVKEGEETLQYYKQSAEFVLERHLKREEALKSTAEPVKTFTNKAKSSKPDPPENVYLRKDVLNVKSAETWHKQGRAPKHGEQPMKRVPYRAATLNRKREILEAERETGQKVQQGLFSWDQTDWIIPDPIKDGIIPKNAYGNIDLFAEHMLPAGGVHIPYKHSPKICRKLGIDHAEAVVDFEFGNRMAVPVIRGVVIAAENEETVMEELEKFEAERQRKEDEKRRKKAIAMWRRFMMGLRIWKRLGGADEGVFGHQKDPEMQEPEANKETHVVEGDMGGGFLPAGYVEEEEDEPKQSAGFFPVANDEDEDEDDDGGLVMDEDIFAPSTRVAVDESIDDPPISPAASIEPQVKPDFNREEGEEDEELIDSKRGTGLPRSSRGKASNGRAPRRGHKKRIKDDSDEHMDDGGFPSSDSPHDQTSEYFAADKEGYEQGGGFFVDNNRALESAEGSVFESSSGDHAPSAPASKLKPTTSGNVGRGRGRGRGRGGRSSAKSAGPAVKSPQATPTRRSTRQRKTVVDDSDVYMDDKDEFDDSDDE